MITLLGDFKTETEEITVSNILYAYNFKNLVKQRHVSKTQKNHMYRFNSD